MMKISYSVHGKIDAGKLAAKVQNDKAFWTYAANEWHRLISPWTPMRTGNLYRNVTITPGEIKYNAPYAYAVYYATNRNFNPTLHPLATAKWDRAARPSQEDKLIDTLQDYIDSGRLDLNE